MLSVSVLLTSLLKLSEVGILLEESGLGTVL